MALGWRTLRALPRLRTYAEAERRERETKPIRGDENGLKPIAQRSMKWRHIKREDDGTISVYESNCPGTYPLLTFRPDDTVLVRPSAYWNKATSHDIIQEILGLNVWTEKGDSWVRCNGGTFKLRQQPRRHWDSNLQKFIYPEYIPEKHDNVFKWKPYESGKYPGGTWEYLNPPAPLVHQIDRKRAKAVRDRYAPFRVYLNAMTKLRRDNVPQFEEYEAVFGLNDPKHTYQPHQYYKPWYNLKVTRVDQCDHKAAAELCALMQSDKPEDQYKAYLWLSLQSIGIESKNMDRVLMMHHRDEMLKVVDRGHGSKHIDRYAWAFPEQEQTT